MKQVIYTITLLLLTGIYTSAQEHFVPVDTTGLPYIIVIDDVMLNNVGGNECEVAVFDDTLCVGTTHYDGINNAQITAWEGSESLGLPGFVSGNPMIYKIWIMINNEFQELRCNPEYEKGNGTFGYGSYSAVTLSCESVLGVSSFRQEKQCQINCFPNPFNHSSRIEYFIPTRSPFSVEIYNLNGKKVFQRHEKSMKQERCLFNWNGQSDSGDELPSGVYLVSIRSEGLQVTSKITYLK